MEKNNDLILIKAFSVFDINTSDIKTNEIGNSANLIYDIESKNNQYILRISKQAYEYLPQYEAEIDYLNYLFINDINVPMIIPSMTNKLVEVISYNNEYYFISLFTKANGHHPQIDNLDEWNEELFYHWGKTMGKIHFVTKNYKSPNDKVKRKHWNEDIYFKEIYDLRKSDYDLTEIWTKIVNEIGELPKDKNSYGIIHNDFHQCNFFIYDGKITVFDFDDCLYSWYICDIAIAIYHSLQTVPTTNMKERESFEIKFMENFIKGYLSENYISKEWLKKIPLFLEYRRICSYKFFLKLWSDNELSEFQKEYLSNMKDNIVNRLPYNNIEFDMLNLEVK